MPYFTRLIKQRLRRWDWMNPHEGRIQVSTLLIYKNYHGKNETKCDKFLIIEFACPIGLKPAEVCESVRLIKSRCTTKYYNPERQVLEQFRFSEIFLRQTKKAYISFITLDNLQRIGILGCKTPIPTRNAITHACQRRHIKMD